MSTNKEKARIKQLILQELLEITELWFDKPMAQHIVTMLRPYTGAYHWTDEQLLKKIELYRAELEEDVIDGE